MGGALRRYPYTRFKLVAKIGMTAYNLTKDKMQKQQTMINVGKVRRNDDKNALVELLVYCLIEWFRDR